MTANSLTASIDWLRFIKRKMIFRKRSKCWRGQHSKMNIISPLCKSIFAIYQRFVYVSRITTESVEISTEIGVLYLRINDNKKAFDKLFEVIKSYENCSKALLALGSILQVTKEARRIEKN